MWLLRKIPFDRALGAPSTYESGFILTTDSSFCYSISSKANIARHVILQWVDVQKESVTLVEKLCSAGGAEAWGSGATCSSWGCCEWQVLVSSASSRIEAIRDIARIYACLIQGSVFFWRSGRLEEISYPRRLWSNRMAFSCFSTLRVSVVSLPIYLSVYRYFTSKQVGCRVMQLWSCLLVTSDSSIICENFVMSSVPRWCETRYGGSVAFLLVLGNGQVILATPFISRVLMPRSVNTNEAYSARARYVQFEQCIELTSGWKQLFWKRCNIRFCYRDFKSMQCGVAARLTKGWAVENNAKARTWPRSLFRGSRLGSGRFTSYVTDLKKKARQKQLFRRSGSSSVSSPSCLAADRDTHQSEDVDITDISLLEDISLSANMEVYKLQGYVGECDDVTASLHHYYCSSMEWHGTIGGHLA